MSKTILAVDDSASLRQMVAFTLSRAGYTVLEAGDGQEAFEMAQAQVGQIDMVLADQNMPRMDGLTLVKSLRATATFKATPILILTTESSDAMKAAGKAAGATGWMVKPFDPNKLVELVGKVIGQA
jgi:two-component system chemotaxis response regulator CheY